MNKVSNCIVCAQEFNSNELVSVVSAHVNVTRFKICQDCLDKSDPAADYKQACAIVKSYSTISDAMYSFLKVKKLLRKNN